LARHATTRSSLPCNREAPAQPRACRDLAPMKLSVDLRESRERLSSALRIPRSPAACSKAQQEGAARSLSAGVPRIPRKSFPTKPEWQKRIEEVCTESPNPVSLTRKTRRDRFSP